MESELSVADITLINQKSQGKYLVDKYTSEKILRSLEKVQIIEIEREASSAPQTLQEFVRVFLRHMKYPKEEKVFLAIGLRELFSDVKDYELKNSYGGNPAVGQDTIKWESLTSYFIDNIIQGSRIESGLQNKYISKLTAERFKSVYDSQELDQYTPEILGGGTQPQRRFRDSQKIVDSLHHNQGIRNVDYAPSLQTIFVLDNITDQILLYNETSHHYRSVSPRKENHYVDTGILYFSYSRIENRLGACMQDYTIAFWDGSDNFTFEKTISAHLDVLQIYIKYVEFCTKWLTIDQRNILAIWDLENESCELLPKRHEERITETCEIVHIKLFAACSLDKQIILWDLIEKVPAQVIKLDQISAHSMVYAQDFRVLITAQYETNIGIWSFESSDCSILTKLKGHNAQIAAIQMLQDSPLLISADEIGYLKTWDLRTFQCIQTLHFECKSSIHQFLNVNSSKFIGVEYRLHWFEFDEKPQVNANGIEQLNIYPLTVDYNPTYNQLVVLTKSDIRMIDAHNGHISRILANVLTDSEQEQDSSQEKQKRKKRGVLESQANEITQFRLIQEGKKFILGDNQGNIRTFVYENGLLDCLNVGHNQDVTQIRVDTKNKLIISTGWGSSIKVQSLVGQKRLEQVQVDREGKFFSEGEQLSKTELIRHVQNAHFGHEISNLALSLRLNMLATASHGAVFLWDYEFLKLVGGMTNENNEVFMMEFLDPLPLLCSLDASGDIIIWEELLQGNQSFNMYFPQVIIKLGSLSKSDLGMASKLVRFFISPDDMPPSSSHCLARSLPALFPSRLYLKQKAMSLVVSDDAGFAYLFEIESLLQGSFPQCGKSKNMKREKGHYMLRKCAGKSNGIFESEAEFLAERGKVEGKRRLEGRQVPTPIVEYADGEENVGLNTLKFRVANETLVVLKVLTASQQKIIVTSTTSSILKLWSLGGELKCVLNIDQPLPYRWQLQVSTFEQRKRKFLEAKCILDTLRKNRQLISPEKSLMLTELQQSEGLIRPQRVGEEEEGKEGLTFGKFLSRVEAENKHFKNPNKVSLKVMEARKKRESSDPFRTMDKQKKDIPSLRRDLNEDFEERPGQGQQAMTQFSLLDRIDAMVNAPKKFNDKTKEWEKALDDDIKKIKKIKQYTKNFNSMELVSNMEVEELKARLLRVTTSEDPKEEKKPIKRRDNVQLRGLGDLQRDKPIIPSLKSKPPFARAALQEETGLTNASSIRRSSRDKSNRSKAMDNSNNLDKSILSAGIKAILGMDKSSVLGRSRSSKKLVDWQFYASIRPDPLSARNNLNSVTIDESSLYFSKGAVNQVVEQRRMRTKLLNELDFKRKFFSKNFPGTQSEFSYLNNVELKEDQDGFYEPPKFIKELNNKEKRKLVKRKIRQPLSTDRGDTHTSKEETLFLPHISSSRVLKTDRDL